MVKPIVGLFIDAPLQSWDVGSRHTRRGTFFMPTRSAIIGIIAAAMGIDKTSSNEEEVLNQLSQLNLRIYSISPCQEMVDFHIAQNCQSAEDAKKEIRKGRKSNKQNNTIITNRYYLVDSKFIIILECKNEWLMRSIQQGLENPKWGGWLGRKSCIPASPIYWGQFESEETFLSKIQQFKQIKFDIQKFGSLREGENFEDGEWTMSDVPISFGRREYSSRRLSLKFFEGA